MNNRDVARVFEELADLLDLSGEDSFRVSSYRRVARTIDDLPGDINDIAARGALAELPGVGKASAAKIQELLDTGTLALHQKMLTEVPATLLELLRLPNTGPKRVAVLWKERGVTSLAELRAALDEGRLEGLKGFGPKMIEKLREGIEFIARSAGRTRLGLAWLAAETIKEAVRGVSGVRKLEHAGSLRRGQETIGDLDLLCVADDAPAVVQRFTQLPSVTAVLAAGDTKGSVRYALRPDREIQVDLRVVPDASFGAALQYFTGSKEHNVRLRERAVKRGWSLNEYALTEGERVIASKTEEEIYAALDLPWIPPEMREDRGEFDLKETPRLITLDDLRGDLHMHTVASDGKHTIAEMVAAAKACGYEYVCITDHSRSSVIANGLSAERLREHIDEVRRVGAKFKGMHVWAGAEVDIHVDGTLDYDDDLLAELDWVVASVHQAMGRDIEANTQRTIAAIRSPYVNVIAHPTGRLINRRDAMPLDIDAISRAAAETGTALEINASLYRLDLKDQHARLARERGVKLCIDTDAHATEQLDQMRFGVLTARRAWLTPADVVNTWPAKDVRAFVERKRSAARG